MPLHSIVDLVGEISDDTFTFSFPYLSQDHIHVYLDGVEEVAFTFSSDYILLLDTPLVAAATVRVQRLTPIDEPVVDFVNGSVLGESDLDASGLQLLYAMQETTDDQTNNLRKNAVGIFDAESIKILNVATPTLTTDAANKAYVDAAEAAAIAAINAEEAAAIVAINAAEAASIVDINAAEAASIVDVNATGAAQIALATAQAVLADASRVAAETAETNAELAETNAELAETNAETAETNAELAETNAEAAQTAAAASESAAAASAAAALASEVAAAASAALSDVANIIDAKGDLFVGSVDNAFDNLPVGSDGSALIALAAATLGVYWQPGALLNSVLLGGYFTVTMAANAVTIAIKTLAGTDPSATTPVWVEFRSVTITDGTPVLRAITAATSLVISAGSTLGCTSGNASRVYVDVIDNAGTVELAVHQSLYDNGSDTQSLVPPSESALVTTYDGGAGAADAAGTLYSTTAQTSKPWRMVGYFESTQATAGTWATAPSLVQQMRLGVHRTGDIVQLWYTQKTSAQAFTTPYIPWDNSVPQNAEGTNLMALYCVPTSNINRIFFDAVVHLSCSAASEHITVYVQEDSGQAMGCAAENNSSGGEMHCISLHFQSGIATAAGRTYSLKASAAGGTTTFNGITGGAKLGGSLVSHLSVREVFV